MTIDVSTTRDARHPITGTTNDSVRPLRIACVVSTFDAGGLERCVANLVNHLEADRFDPLVISLARSGSAADWVERKNIPILEIGKRPGNDLRAVGRLAEILRSEQIDIVHSHNWGTLLETVIARRRAGIPVHVHAEHGQELESIHAPRLKRFVRRQAMHWGYRRVDAIVACAKSVSERLLKQFPEQLKRVSVIPNGVTVGGDESAGFESCPEALRDSSRRLRDKLGIPSEATVLGSLSRLAKVKDFPTAIRALSLLVSRGRDCYLVLAGEGSERESLEQAAISKNVESRVHFVGNQSNIRDWLEMFDLYLNSSLSEAMSLGILEAMAAGRPIVATDVGDSRLLIDGTAPCGIVVPSGNPGAMADAIETLLDDPPLRITMGTNGVQRHAERYSVRRMVDDFANLYLKLSCRTR